MTIFTIIMLVCVGIGAFVSFTTPSFVKSRKPKHVLPVKPQPTKLSNPAQKILDLYNQLPETSRVLGDLREQLEKLDANFGRDHVDSHFSAYRRSYGYGVGGFVFDWDKCEDSSCKFYIYKEMCRVVKKTVLAWEEQREAMQRASLDDLGINGMMEQLRTEAQALRGVAQELNARTNEAQ